eukprot:8878128-Pyramimonas_sp.AAC.1
MPRSGHGRWPNGLPRASWTYADVWDDCAQRTTFANAMSIRQLFQQWPQGPKRAKSGAPRPLSAHASRARRADATCDQILPCTSGTWPPAGTLASPQSVGNAPA